ncbi:enoyl-CoA hydratase-related protein [soil metagenome]
MVTSDPVRLEWSHPAGTVADLILARPKARNAFDDGLGRDLTVVFSDLSRMPAERLRAVVLSGDGAAFCAGADIGWMKAAATLGEEANRRSAETMADMFEAIDRCPSPVVAQVHWVALGGVSLLCAVADIVIAEAATTFGFTEVRLGILPAVIAPYVLARIGEGHARALFASGARFNADRARDIGLVHEVATGSEALRTSVAAAVSGLLAAGPQAARAAKALIGDLRGRSHQEARTQTTRLIAEIRVSGEAQEGLRAFLERRRPAWDPTDPSS